MSLPFQTLLLTGAALFVVFTLLLFAALALAFSTPQVGRIQLAVDGNGDAISPAESRSVLIFGGGYNGGRMAGAKVGKDLNNSRNSVAAAQVGLDDGSGTEDRGNALFMIDAASGQLIWRAVRSKTASAAYTSTGGTRSYTHPMLVDSIASDLTALDTDNDGFTDRLYVGDTGGRLWRADFPGALPSAWTITPIASIGRHNAGNNTLANDRRIFFAPDFVPVRNADNTQGTDLILFGTGDREDPLNLVTENSFYALRDTDAAVGARLRIIGESFAGGTPPPALNQGECVRIFTGAAMPDGSDRVVMQENCIFEGTEMTIVAKFGPGWHVRQAASDFAEGDLLVGHVGLRCERLGHPTHSSRPRRCRAGDRPRSSRG